ncbi:hypothetical protein DL771_001802 [Monosporascus sp. 5C6A]|nr:hypothetical protein DL771_001802 [Monosporascus sp. 5C6A]
MARSYDGNASTVADPEGSPSTYKHAWNMRYSPTHDHSDHPFPSEDDPIEHRCPKTSVLLFRQHRRKAALEIVSPMLTRVLRDIMRPLSVSQKEDRHPPMLLIKEPYEPLFHNWKRISQAGRDSSEAHVNDNVQHLLDFLKSERMFTWEKLDEIEDGLCNSIAFEDLWLLYPPGGTVFSMDRGAWRAYKVDRVEAPPRLSSDSMIVHCYYLDFDKTGNWLVPHAESFNISPYSAERAIDKLHLVPNWYLHDLSEKLIERGKKYSIQVGANLDLIQGKGQGLNVLLHGNSGTGKTLTVESFAEAFQIPLYTVTCGELGYDSDALEERLQQALLRATNWKAILLLEEADVFVQFRDFDLRRYAVVSSFLRHLDYSQAVVFMTTNRVTKFDPALLSRIHINLWFPDFDFKAQQEVWKDVINRLEDLNREDRENLTYFINYELEKLDERVYTHMNGRQIRNCISAAAALARGPGKNGSLKPIDVKNMLKLGKEFSDYYYCGDIDMRFENLGRQAELEYSFDYCVNLGSFRKFIVTKALEVFDEAGELARLSDLQAFYEHQLEMPDDDQ